MLNTPRAMLERLAYLGWLMGTGTSVVAMLISALRAWQGMALATFFVGVAGLILMKRLWSHGVRHWHFEDCENSLSFSEIEARPDEPSEDTVHRQRVHTLRKVLRDWEELDEASEQKGMDVWRRHELRQEARSLLAADPKLRREFRPDIERRPELDDR